MTYSRAVRTTIGPKCLTAVFGMGTGVATWVWSPESRLAIADFRWKNAIARYQMAAGRVELVHESVQGMLGRHFPSCKGRVGCIVNLQSRICTLQSLEQRINAVKRLA